MSKIVFSCKRTGQNILSLDKYFVHAEGQGIGQKEICPGQDNLFCGQKFCPWLKSPFLLLKSLWKWLLSCKNGVLCLVLLHGQNIFCLGQNLNCPRQKMFCPVQKFCTWLKSPFLLLKSLWKWLLSSKNGLLSCEQNCFVMQKDWSEHFSLGQIFFV